MASFCLVRISFQIFLLLNLPQRGSDFFGTSLVNCIYLTVEKSKVESKSGLIGTLLAPCRAVHDNEW